MTLVGITLDTSTDLISGAELVKLVKRIEYLGFESVWLLDAFGREPFVAATYILSNTTRLKVGTGVATVYGRDPTSAAQTRQTLSELYPDRFLMGIGVSNPQVIAMRKGEWSPPLKKMSSYLKDMAEVHLAAGEAKSLAPLYIAAHAPKLQLLAKELGDGILTWIMPANIVELARQRIGTESDITASIPCVLNTDPVVARATGRKYLEFYLGLDYYQAAFIEAGFSTSDFAEGGSDWLIDQIVAWGDAAAIAERIRRFEEAGATRVVLNPTRVMNGESIASGIDNFKLESDWDGLESIAASISKN